MAAATSGLLALVMVCAGVWGAPARTRVTTDQRQSGELNIHASLENVLIVLIPSSSATDLLTLAGLKRPGLLLQTLLSKKNKYDVEVEDHNDINTDIVAPGDLGQEEVVATVEEMTPHTTARVTDPPRVEAAEDPSSAKKQSTVGETVQESVISIIAHEEPKEPVKAAEDEAKKENSELTKEKEDALADISAVDITQKPESDKTTEMPTKEVASTPEKGVSIESSMTESKHTTTKKDLLKESLVKDSKHTASEKDELKEYLAKEFQHTTPEKDTPKESPMIDSQHTTSEKDELKEYLVKEFQHTTPEKDTPKESSMIDSQHTTPEKDTPKESSMKDSQHTTSKKDTPKESSMKDSQHTTSEKDTPKESSMEDSQHTTSEEDTPKESSMIDSQHTTPEKDTPKESSMIDSQHTTPEKDTPKEPSVQKYQLTATGLIRPAHAKEAYAVESTSSKKTVEEDKIATPVKKVGDPVRREKALQKYQVETKWAPGLVGLIGPLERYAGLCAPGRWDPELRTCLMPGETRSRAELARFLGAMRLGIAVPTK